MLCGVEMEKRIELVKVKVTDLKLDYKNPRVITSERLQNLERSLKTLGDFSVIVIDEDNNVISGNQRCKAIINYDPDAIVDCKRLIGYTEEEKKVISIKSNTHEGRFSSSFLKEFLANLNTDLDLCLDTGLQNGMNFDTKRPLIDRIANEKPFFAYDYVVFVFENSFDFEYIKNVFGIEEARDRYSSNVGLGVILNGEKLIELLNNK